MRGLLIYEAPNHDVVSRRIRFVHFSENRACIVHGVGEKYGSRFKEVLDDGRIEDEACFDEVGMDLVEVFGRSALL